jgi:hypothetical protein
MENIVRHHFIVIMIVFILSQNIICHTSETKRVKIKKCVFAFFSKISSMISKKSIDPRKNFDLCIFVANLTKNIFAQNIFCRTSDIKRIILKKPVLAAIFPRWRRKLQSDSRGLLVCYIESY